MTNLPYANSLANPVQAQARIKSMLIKFGVDRISFAEDLKARTVIVNFQYKNYPVHLPVDYGRLAEVYMEGDPWSHRKRGTREAYEQKKRETAYRASFSLLEDFLKGMITIAQMEIFTFEEMFFAYFINDQGVRFGEIARERLPELLSGRLALGV